MFLMKALFTAKDILDQKKIKSLPLKLRMLLFCETWRHSKEACEVAKYLPHITLFYNVRCNDSRARVSATVAIGEGFDCANKTEIQLVQGLGVPTERIIYASPCTQVSPIKNSTSVRVQMLTYDSEIEFMKVTRAHLKAKWGLWIATDNSKAVCHLSDKFSATLKTCRLVLE